VVNKTITIAVESNKKCETALAEAIEAHNSTTQRTTNFPPEVLLLGRRRRIRVPILGPTVVRVDTGALRNRDKSQKNRTRHRENTKRHARFAEIKAGDEVVVKRHQKGKDDTRFGPARFKVISGNSGDYTIKGPDGRILNRNVIHLKRHGKRRAEGLQSQLPITCNLNRNHAQNARRRCHHDFLITFWRWEKKPMNKILKFVRKTFFFSSFHYCRRGMWGRERYCCNGFSVRIVVDVRTAIIRTLG
jgi:hypothetical protein